MHVSNSCNSLISHPNNPPLSSRSTSSSCEMQTANFQLGITTPSTPLSRSSPFLTLRNLSSLPHPSTVILCITTITHHHKFHKYSIHSTTYTHYVHALRRLQPSKTRNQGINTTTTTTTSTPTSFHPFFIRHLQIYTAHTSIHMEYVYPSSTLPFLSPSPSPFPFPTIYRLRK